jgi:hypothetical protein
VISRPLLCKILNSQVDPWKRLWHEFFFVSPFHSNGLLPDAYSKTVSEWLRICRYIWIGKTNYLLFFHDTINDLSPFRLPRGWSGGNLRRPFLPPIFRIGWVQGCGWLGPPLSFVLANAQVEAGVKGQRLQMTILHLSYVLSSLSPGPSIPNLSPYPILSNCLAISLQPVTPSLGSLAIKWSPRPASNGSPGQMRLFGMTMTANLTKYQLSLLTYHVLSNIFKRLLLTTEVFIPYVLVLSISPT